MTDHFSELVNRGNEVAAATGRLSPDGQWTVGFGLVGLGLAIAIRAGIRGEVQRAQLPPVHVQPAQPPSRQELIELHRERIRELEEGEPDGES